jgi:hypothetical protein
MATAKPSALVFLRKYWQKSGACAGSVRRFPDLMAVALSKRDLTHWAQQQGLKLARG